MTDRRARNPLVALLALATMVGGCSMGTLNGIISSETPDTAPVASTAARGPAPAINMTGKWMLATSGADSCNMNFAGTPDSENGTIAPEGGCPWKLFTSRQWELERNTVIIRNHAGETLAQLNVIDSRRLEGQRATGELVTLTR